MEYRIRPVEPKDAPGLSAIRRMPGVFETILGNPGENPGKMETMIAGLGADDYFFVAVTPDGQGG